MEEDEKVIKMVLPAEFARKLDEIVYFPPGIVSGKRIRAFNCRFLLTRGLGRHIDTNNFRIKEPIHNIMLSECDTEIGFIVPAEVDQALNELKKHYNMMTKKALTGLLIYQEIKYHEEGGF